MFKKEINSISDYYLKNKSVDHITLKELKNCGIHPAILKYTSAAIDKVIVSDRKRAEHNSICNYKSAKIEQYFKLIEAEIKLNQKFNEPEINQILLDAVIFNVQYLTQPNYALTNFVFGNSKIKSVEEIHNSLSHVHYYQFIRKVIYKYLNDKKTLEIERKEFVDLLTKIDKIGKRKYLQESLASAICSISDFFDVISDTPELIQINTIKLYLEEKGLSEFINIIESKYGNDTTRFINSKDLIGEFNAAINEAELLIKETDHFEDDKINNHSKKIIDNDLETEDNSEYLTENIVENASDVNSEKLLISEEILEIDNNEVEIPNNEILSNDEIVEYKEEEFAISKDEDVLEASEILEPIESVNAEEEDIVNHELNSEGEKGKRSNSTLKDLVDLNPIYEALLTPILPFDTWKSEFIPITSSDDSSAEVGYQLDPTSLSEEIDLGPNKKDNFSYFDSKNTELSEENISNFNEDEEIVFPSESLKNIKISDTEFESNIEQTTTQYKNLVSDELTEDYVSTDSFDVPIEENGEKIIEKDNFVVNNNDSEEITEVFTDLAFLDHEPTSNTFEEPKLDFEDTTEEVDESEENESNYDNYNNFSEMVASKDMTKIIECIFDYDMEDYHSVLNQISNSENESKASELILEYCNANHIELNAKEVDSFQFLISEYFTQAYS